MNNTENIDNVLKESFQIKLMENLLLLMIKKGGWLVISLGLFTISNKTYKLVYLRKN